MSTAQAQAVSQALSQADGVATGGQTQQSQPVEFNHAINYVNKIKVGLLARRKRVYINESHVKCIKCMLFSESVPGSTR